MEDRKMAGFVTANRWATGVKTHKTSEGRILCTGVGCVGCFPEVLTEEANELGVCDLDLSGSILGLRPFLDLENSRENLKLKGKHFPKIKKNLKPKIRGRKRTMKEKKDSSEGDLRDFGNDKGKSGDTSSSTSEIQPQTTSTVATQTEPSELQPLSKLVSDVHRQDLLTLDEGNRPEIVGNSYNNHAQIGANCNIVQVDDNVNKTHRNPVGLFTQPSGSRLEKIHDKIYIASGRNIALSSCDSSLTHKDTSAEQANDLTTTTEQQPPARGEDAVCFFFALEYYNSQRMLPDFRVMEIVEALSKDVDLRDIKCVQRISRRWHMVLKSRKYIRLLRHSGLKLRGRVYQLVDDVDGYFDLVQ